MFKVCRRGGPSRVQISHQLDRVSVFRFVLLEIGFSFRILWYWYSRLDYNYLNDLLRIFAGSQPRLLRSKHYLYSVEFRID